MRLQLCKLTIAMLSPLYALQPMHTFTWKQCTHMGFVCSSAHCYMSQHPSQSQLTPFIIEYLRNKLKLK